MFIIELSLQLSYPNWNSHYNSTDARLGSMQQHGRKATILTPLALCGPILAKVARTEVLPPSQEHLHLIH